MSTTALSPGSRADRIRDLEETRGNAAEVNVGEAERLVSGIAGAGLVVAGVRRGGPGGAALALLGTALGYRAVTGHCHAYESMDISTAGKPGAAFAGGLHHGLKVIRSFTINRSPEDCYKFWRDFRNLPRFMEHLESVTILDDRHSRWVARGPFGNVTWDAEIINDTPNELISWRSLEGADVDNAGSVRFRPAPGNRGTEVTVELNYEPPAGRLGASIARLLGENPDQQVRDDLRHFKQLMEAGEIPTVHGQPSGRA